MFSGEPADAMSYAAVTVSIPPDATRQIGEVQSPDGDRGDPTREFAALSAERRNMVGSAERAQKIRTYNFPQNRVTDHRIGLTLHKLDRIMDGDLDDLISALRAHRQAELLKQGA